MFLALDIYPTLGGSVLLVVGLVAAVGYAKTQAQKVWRESSEGWRAENEANKAKAERVAADLLTTAAALKAADARTDITIVLNTLANQHREATAILTRIADESRDRNGHIAAVLADSNERVAIQHAEIMKLGNETLKTVKALNPKAL